MKTIILPNGKEVVQNRLPRAAYTKLRTSKVINRKKANNRQDEKKIIQEQLEEYEQE